MFPWSPEFALDTAHVVFFGALYGVVATMALALGVAAWRARRDAREGRGSALAWHVAFADLPRAARACRHALTGEAPGRCCENAFDCRSCGEHRGFELLRTRQAAGPGPDTGGLGFELPLDRFYHRGHTWARLERDGSVTVGLDGVARRLVGTPERIEAPAPGTRLRVNDALFHVRSRGSEVRLLCPVDGTLVSTRGEGASLTLRVDPGGVLDVRHLLSGAEARAWALRELERLQRAFGPAGQAALADGGELVDDVGAALPRGQHDALLGDLLLEP
jgi:hypothetical protein